MTKKKKRIKVGRLLLLIIILLFITLAVWYLFFNKKNIVVAVIDKIDNYDYVLKNIDSNAYKNNYNELKQLLNDDTTLDEEKYAELISKLFLIDFYTLNNKVTNQDVGGVQYINSSLHDKFIDVSTNGVYKYIKNNINGNRKQRLPEVKNVDILSLDKVKYTNDNKEYNDSNAYLVKASIKYKKDLGYAKKVTLVITHETDSKLSIIEIKNED